MILGTACGACHFPPTADGLDFWRTGFPVCRGLPFRSWRCLAALRHWLFVLLLGTAGAATCLAATIPVGAINYSTLIPGDTSPGVTHFSISNLTGDALSGGYGLPPDFPVVSFLDFANAQITVTVSGAAQVFLLGTIGPGFFDSPLLEFTDTTQFESAIFTGTLAGGTYLLSDGSVVTAIEQTLTATILPSFGNFLQPDIDFALVLMQAEPFSGVEVPEPSTGFLVVAGLLASTYASRTRRRE